MPKQRKVVSLTQALTGQDLQAIIEDLCAIVREWYSDSRHAPRAISAACISAIEQLCRHLIALQLSRDGSTVPQTLTIDIVSMHRAAGMPPAVLVSFAYNFQGVEVIIEVLRGHGIGDPFRGKEWPKRDYGILVEFRHGRIHTSTYKDFNRPAACETAGILAVRPPRQFPDMLIDMRLLHGTPAHGQSARMQGPRRDRPRAAAQGRDGGRAGARARSRRPRLRMSRPDNPDGGRAGARARRACRPRRPAAPSRPPPSFFVRSQAARRAFRFKAIAAHGGRGGQDAEGRGGRARHACPWMPDSGII